MPLTGGIIALRNTICSAMHTRGTRASGELRRRIGDLWEVLFEQCEVTGVCGSCQLSPPGEKRDQRQYTRPLSGRFRITI